MQQLRLFLVCCIVTFAKGQDEPTVTIPGLGTLLGDTDVSIQSGRIFNRFRAVPYAAPPSGVLRFQPPAPAIPWDGTLNATHLGRKCPQTTITRVGDWQRNVLSKFEADDDVEKAGDIEDCLFLHIYTPQGAGNNLPVIIFYHGGSFQSGSAILYGPERFMDFDVVLVVAHYRLGPLGFLSLGNDAIPGNAGLLDQVAALQFVKSHISLFGGNPNRITVMGESAGAASTELLHLSPLSTGLFQQYISQSGGTLGTWAIDEEPIRSATEIGRLSNCLDLNLNELTECFLNIDAMTLLKAFDTFSAEEIKAGRTGFSGSTPVVQTAGAVRFLEKHPRTILNEGSYVYKPALLGANKNEGTAVYLVMYEGYLVPNGLENSDVYLQRPFTDYALKFFDVTDVGESVAAGIERSYFGVENMGNITAMASGVIDFTGNMFFKGPTYEMGHFNSINATTYVYSYNYDGASSLWPYFTGLNPIIPGGVCHANELLLLYNIPSFVLLTEEEEAMSTKMLQLWTNFITFGNPTPVSNPVEGIPTWLPYSKSERNYMRIDLNFALMNDVTLNEYFIAIEENFPW